MTMNITTRMRWFALGTLAAVAATQPLAAHKLREAGVTVEVAKSDLTVTPSVAWNRLNPRTGKDNETWTLDGEELNDVTFYGQVEEGKTLLLEVDKRNRPLPRFSDTMLLTDIPPMLETTYRIARDLRLFEITGMEPAELSGHKAIRFTYEFVGPDEVRRKGEADAAIVDGALYMMTYEAPQIFFFDQSLEKYRQLRDSMALG